jgi:hypothetical protein
VTTVPGPRLPEHPWPPEVVEVVERAFRRPWSSAGSLLAHIAAAGLDIVPAAGVWEYGVREEYESDTYVTGDRDHDAALAAAVDDDCLTVVRRHPASDWEDDT